MRVLITTSRKPSRRTRSFIKELNLVIPGSIRVVRGKMTLHDLHGLTLSLKARGVMIVYERKGNPSAIVYYEGTNEGLRKALLVKLRSVKLRREIGNAQKPLNISQIVVEHVDYLEDLVNAFVRMFNARVCKEMCSEANLIDSVRVSFINDEEHQQVIVRFICVGSNRVCGPQLNVEKVVWY